MSNSPQKSETHWRTWMLCQQLGAKSLEVPLDDTPLSVHFIYNGNEEANGKIVRMSLHAAHIQTDVMPNRKHRLALYIEHIGRISGQVQHVQSGFLDVVLEATANKRDRIADLLIALLHHETPEEMNRRRYDRVQVNKGQVLRLGSGKELKCTVLDISLSGALLATAQRPPIGALVVIGRMTGRIARHHERGIAIEFIRQDTLDTEDPATLL